MFSAHELWCKANSIRAWKETALGRSMPKKGIRKERSNYSRYMDVRLQNVPEEESRRPASYGDDDA